MAIWTELARASNDAGDEILLRQRDDIFEIRYNGLELMSNINFQSETVLAERSLRLLSRAPKSPDWRTRYGLHAPGCSGLPPD